MELKEEEKSVITTPSHHSKKFKEEIDKMIQEILDKGWIWPKSNPFTSSVVLVNKKDGTLRMCVDYCALNKKTINNRYPIPKIDESPDELHGVVIFSIIDLFSGYHQICMRENDVEKTTFNYHYRHYEFLVMSFGLTNSPTTFYSCMNHIFNKKLRNFLLVFFDDILIYNKTWEEHLGHLGRVLGIMESQLLYTKISKCEFGMNEILYPSHIISAQGVQVHEEKIQEILDWPPPKTLSEMCGSFGLCNYYRRFVKGFSQLCASLTDLTKK